MKAIVRTVRTPSYTNMFVLRLTVTLPATAGGQVQSKQAAAMHSMAAHTLHGGK